MQQKSKELQELTDSYCDLHLDSNYKELAQKAIQKMARKRTVPFLSGKINLWAAGIIYGLGQTNFLFDKHFKPYQTAEHICSFFKANKSTVGQKAKVIREMLKFDMMNLEFLTDYMRQNNPLSSMVNVGGFWLNSDLMKDTYTKEDEANEIVELAWEMMSSKKRIHMANQALSIWENCLDAYMLLAFESKPNSEMSEKFFAQAVMSGERDLGKPYFKQNAGHFWGLVETRPYMQARQELALTQWARGKRTEAINHFRDMLVLCPNDNLGVRYILISWFFQEKRLSDAIELVQTYPHDFDSGWFYNKALISFLRNGDCKKSEELLKVAIKENPLIVDYLVERKTMPIEVPDHYGKGDDSEAVVYCEYGLLSWRTYPDALQWLKAMPI